VLYHPSEVAHGSLDPAVAFQVLTTPAEMGF